MGSAVIAERDYALRDPDNEKKWNFKLADALSTAKGGKVFESCTFYITKNVEPSFKVMNDIVKAAGGKVSEDW